MAIIDYTRLQAAINNWAHRNDTGFATEVPNFIALTEARMRTMLTARLQGTSGTITTEAGVISAAQPSGLLRAYSLTIPDVMPTIDYVTPEQFNAQYNSGEVGAPRCYTIIGESFYFGPTPDAVYSIKCAYQAEIPALSASVPTSAFLTKNPNAYLFGALAEAMRFIKDYPAFDRWDSSFQQAISGINLLDWHAGGPLRARSDVRI